MSKSLRPVLVILLLATAILSSYMPPNKEGYKGMKYISNLALPEIPGWRAVDVSEQLRANLQDARYKFISESLGYQYIDEKERHLIMMIINARDFHYPNVCFRSSGYGVTDMGKVSLNASGRSIDAYVLLAKSPGQERDTLVVYWIVIDKDVVTSWVEQKFKQLYFALFNKESIGILVRLDIPVGEDGIKDGMEMAKRLVNGLGSALDGEDADYIFGKK